VKRLKTLIISFYFPPCTDGAATLMYNLCKYLPKQSYHVITAREDLGIYVWDNLGAYDREYFLDCNAVRVPVRTNRLRDRVKFLFFSILSGLTLISKRHINSILAVYPDDFDLYAGYALHKLTGKPLIVYMHDLYYEVRREARLHRILELFERKIFSSASAVLVTNEKFRDYYLAKGIRNAVLLHSCIDLDRSGFVRLSQNDVSGKRLRIVFTGTVYGSNRDAVDAFLKAAKKTDDVEVIFATPQKNTDLHVSIGFLPKKKCFELQKSADVLFLPLSFCHPSPEEMKCAFPCKVLEYLAAGKPILGVVPQGSFTEELIEKYDVGIVVTEPSEDKIVDAINRLKDEKARELYSENAFKTAKIFDAKIQARKLCSIVDTIVEKAPAIKCSRVE
jgi:glycosyltransferase involved in cell wall biosynthesis